MHRPKSADGIGHAISQFLKFTRAGILGVLAISAQEGGAGLSFMPWVTLVLSLWQMISFVTDPALGAPWPSSVAPIDVGGSFTNLRAYTRLFPSQTFAAAAYYLAVAWVFVLVALLVWGVFNFARETVPFLWPLRLLKLMANLSVGALNIPLLQLLLEPLNCRDAAVCDTAWSAVKGGVGVALAAALTLLTLLFAAAFYDSASLSRRLDASAHGRVSVIMLVVKLSATVVGGRVITGLSVAFVASALGVCGVAWLGAYLYFLPHYRFVMNAANVGCALAFLWSLVCLVLNNGYPSTDAALMLWTGMPFAILTGAYMATGRASALVARPPAQLASSYEVELQNRLLLHHALYGHHLYRIPDSTSGAVSANAQLAAMLLQDGGTGDEQARSATLREALPRELLARVLATYRSAAARFPDSAIIHLYTARFQSEYMGNKHMMCVWCVVCVCVRAPLCAPAPPPPPSRALSRLNPLLRATPLPPQAEPPQPGRAQCARH